MPQSRLHRAAAFDSTAMIGVPGSTHTALAAQGRTRPRAASLLLWAALIANPAVWPTVHAAQEVPDETATTAADTSTAESLTTSVAGESDADTPAAVAAPDSLTEQASPATQPVRPMGASAEEISRLIPDPLQVNNTDLPARDVVVHLSLEEVIRRTLRHSLDIKVEGYNPAIRGTEIVRAQAAFDAIFFTEFGYQSTDEPPNTWRTIEGIQTDGWTSQAGVRQRFPTGATAEGRIEYSSFYTDPRQARVYYPNVTADFVAELRQPLLRNFGLDTNRSQIDISRNQKRQAIYTYSREVRDTLNEVHAAYWDLVFARRNIVIARELLEQTRQTYIDYRNRAAVGLDAIRAQVKRVEATLSARQAEFIAFKNNVKDAEDRLKVLINDPELNLSTDIEIIPTDEPLALPIITDRLAEIQTALQNREELQEARLVMENARISVGFQRNQLLPVLDAVMRVRSNGTDENFSAALGQSLAGDYLDLFVGFSLEVPIGNRAAQADYQRAKLQLSQALAAIRRVVEQIVADVNASVRRLAVRSEQISPSRLSVEAAAENVRVLVAKTDRFDPPFLDSRLTALEQLASSRRQLLQTLVEYNKALAEVERSKGTLLKYHAIVVSEEELDRADTDR